MYIEDMDEAYRLRRHREQYAALRAAAETGSMSEFIIRHEGEKRDVFSTIEATCVRKAIVEECDRMIAQTESELGRIGVNVAPKLRRAG